MAEPEGSGSIVLAPLGPQDWNGVLGIYQEGLDSGQASFETVAPEWAGWDAAHLAHPRLVARQGSDLIGWAALSPVSQRAVYAGVAEISVYVAGGHRGRGVGRRLLEALIQESEAAGIWTLQASIFPENLASVRLHEACRFRLLGRRERIARHQGVWRDTLIFERRSAVVGR